MSDSASSGNAALPHDNVGGYHHYPDCQGGPDCNCCEREQDSRALPCSARFADNVTVGELLRLIRKKHINALAQRKPDHDMARAMHRLELDVEGALEFYRISRPNAQSEPAKPQENE